MDKLAAETGRTKNELPEDATLGYFEELGQIRQMAGRMGRELASRRAAGHELVFII